MAKFRNLVIGGVVGAAAAYFLDPEHGAVRRARVQAGVEGRLREGRDHVDRTARQLGERARATLAELRAAESRPDDDLSVLNRVESALLGLPGLARGAVEGEVIDGQVVLRGEVASEEQEREVVAAASDVRGVAGVESLLQVQ